MSLKILENEASAAQRRRFERDARGAARLEHPGILSVFELGECEGRLFAATELLEGETLRQRLERGALPLPEALRIGAELAAALGSAHSRGVVHRNLRPETVFLPLEGPAKVLDFGWASLQPLLDPAQADADSTLTLGTRTMPLEGSLGAMAPEQLRGEDAAPSADLFAFGALLHEMLTGVHPFARSSRGETVAAVLRDEAPPLTGRPAVLNRLVARCLARDPLDRYANGRELELALAAAQQPKAGSWSSSRRWIVPALFLLAALAVGLVQRGWMDQRAILVYPFGASSQAAAPNTFSLGMTDALIRKLQGISGIRVMSYSTSLEAQRAGSDLGELFETLDLDGVVLGSARQDTRRATLSASLVVPPEGKPTWQRDVAAELDAVLSVHGDLAFEISEALGVPLTRREKQQLRTGRRTPHEALMAFLAAQCYREDVTPQCWARALVQIDRALAIDPLFPEAHAAAATIHAWNPLMGGSRVEESLPRAMWHAQRAIALAPEIAASHIALGTAHLASWRWDEAELAYRRAVRLEPGSADAHLQLSELLRETRRWDEALIEARYAARLDPLSPATRTRYGWIPFEERRYQVAIGIWDAVLEAHPDFLLARYNLGLAHHALGMYDEAEQDFASSLAFASHARPWRAVADAARGNLAPARALLAELEGCYPESGHCRPTMIAGLHIALGDENAALDWLEEAYRAHDHLIVPGTNDKGFDPIRGHPRFRAVMRRIGLNDPFAPPESGERTSRRTQRVPDG